MANLLLGEEGEGGDVRAWRRILLGDMTKTGHIQILTHKCIFQ